MILASISGGQSLGKPLPDLSRQGQNLCEGPFSVSCRKSKPFKPSDAVGFDEKSPALSWFSISNGRRRDIMIKGLFQALRSRIGRSKYQLLREAQARAGKVRQQEELGLLPRPNYAYGMLRAADLARYLGLKRVTICEFGVATGNGLIAMVDLAGRLSRRAALASALSALTQVRGCPRLAATRTTLNSGRPVTSLWLTRMS